MAERYNIYEATHNGGSVVLSLVDTVETAGAADAYFLYKRTHPSAVPYFTMQSLNKAAEDHGTFKDVCFIEDTCLIKHEDKPIRMGYTGTSRSNAVTNTMAVNR